MIICATAARESLTLAELTEALDAAGTSVSNAALSHLEIGFVLRRDRDATVREHAASALGRLGDRRAVPALTEALRDESAVVREHAASALGRLAEGRATR